MELREVWAALRRGWWLPLLGMVLGGGAALTLSLLQTPLYSSSTQLFVKTPGTTSPSEAFAGGEFSAQRVIAYAQLVHGEELAGLIVNRLGLSMSPKDLSAEITAAPVTDSVLINVTVTDPSPRQAQRIAEAVGTEFPVMASRLETVGMGEASPVSVSVTQRPDLPQTPSSPDTVRRLGTGLLVGLILGASAALVRARLDRTVRDPAALATMSGVAVAGVITRDERLVRGRPVELVDGSRTAEDYRQLRTLFHYAPETPRAILISSALPDEGRTTLAIGLALALAEGGKRVALIDADLRRPQLAERLGRPNDVGLTDVLLDDVAIDQAVVTHRSDLTVIPGGRTPVNAGELFASGGVETVIGKLRGEHDFVVVDGPPLLPTADASGIAGGCDGVLLAVRYGRTRRDQVQAALSRLDGAGARALGIVLTAAPPEAQVVGARREACGRHSPGSVA